MEIESNDVIRIVMEFLKENKLEKTRLLLESESGIRENLISDKQELRRILVDEQDWKSLFEILENCSLPDETLWKLYDVFCIAMLLQGNDDVCKIILRENKDLDEMKLRDGARFDQLQYMVYNKDPKLHEKFTAEVLKQNRIELFNSLCSSLTESRGSRLVTLLGQSFAYQRDHGILVEEDPIFGNASKRHKPNKEKRKLSTSSGSVVGTFQMVSRIKLVKKSPANAVCFLNDHATVCTGTTDGFVELWSVQTGKLRKDLAYQAEDRIMSHRQMILGMAFDTSGTRLATCSSDGTVKIWNIQSGECTTRIKKAHDGKMVTCVAFLKDSVLSGGHDNTVRRYGCVSGGLLSAYKGHKAPITSIAVIEDRYVGSVSSDRVFHVWDVETGGGSQLFSHEFDSNILGGSVRCGCSEHASWWFMVCLESQEVHFIPAHDSKERRRRGTLGMVAQPLAIAWRNPNWLYVLTNQGNVEVFRVDEMTSVSQNTLTLQSMTRGTICLEKGDEVQAMGLEMYEEYLSVSFSDGAVVLYKNVNN